MKKFSNKKEELGEEDNDIIDEILYDYGTDTIPAF